MQPKPSKWDDMRGVNLIERLRFLFNYDPETGVITWANPTARNVKHGQIAGGPDRHGYIKIAVYRKIMAAHRVAWMIHHGKEPSGLIDHRNWDRKDNRITNLRESTKTQNAANSDLTRGATGVRGTTRLESGRYQAQIGGKDGRKYLGTFDTVEEARSAYERASIDKYGEFSPYHPTSAAQAAKQGEK